jgi:hypothetical protein
MRRVEVPLRDKTSETASAAVTAIKDQWAAHAKLLIMRGGYIRDLANDLKLDGTDSRLRWLAYKPPE